MKVTSLSLEEVMQHKKEMAEALKEYASKTSNYFEKQAYLVASDIVENTPLFVKETK